MVNLFLMLILSETFKLFGSAYDKIGLVTVLKFS